TFLAELLVEHLAEPRPSWRAAPPPPGAQDYRGRHAEGEDEEHRQERRGPARAPAEARDPEAPGEEVGDLAEPAVLGLVPDDPVEDRRDVDDVPLEALPRQPERLGRVGKVEGEPLRAVRVGEPAPPDVLAPGEGRAQARRRGVDDEPPRPDELPPHEVGIPER